MTPKRYETAILFNPELTEDARKEFLAKLSGIIASFKGEVLKTDDWGNRKLAYPIKKKANAFYTFLLYTGDRGVVEEVERNIKIFEGILRHLTTLHTADLKPKVEAAAPPAGDESADSGTPVPETPVPEAPASEAPQASAAPAEA
jgi:small subunit ribosomal protein S6